MMDLYVLGILWSIGSPIEDRYPYFMLRHHDRYFLDVVRKTLKISPSVIEGEARPGPQYKLKIYNFDLSQLTQYSWQHRLSVKRNYPHISEHANFIRAYIELHSALDTITIRKRSKERTSPRLRIYGNRYFLAELTKVLSSQVEISTKRVQKDDQAFRIQRYLVLSKSSGVKETAHLSLSSRCSVFPSGIL